MRISDYCLLPQAAQIAAVEAKIKILEDLGNAASLAAAMHDSNAKYYTSAASTLHMKADNATTKQEKNKLTKEMNTKAARATEYIEMKDAAEKAAAAAKEDVEKAKEMISQLKARRG